MAEGAAPDAMTIDRSVRDRTGDGDSDDSDGDDSDSDEAEPDAKKTKTGGGRGGVRYDQYGNKVGGRNPNSATITKHAGGTASIAACFARMVPP